MDLVVQYVMTLPIEQFAGLTVSKLAAHFKTDRFHLSRQFKKCKNMTLDSFIKREKMSRAAFMLLASNEIKVKEIAEIFGFCTCDYFIRTFRDYFGVVPGRYREFKTRRSGIGDRRMGIKERRRKKLKSAIPKSGDRRKGVNDRRKGKGDRRKQPPKIQQETDSSANQSKNCTDCHYREMAIL